MKKNKDKWLKINRESFTRTLKGFERPTSDRIPGACTKEEKPQVQLPEGKTIGIAYNKGNYQIVDKADFKTMGRKT